MADSKRRACCTTAAGRKGGYDLSAPDEELKKAADKKRRDARKEYCRKWYAANRDARKEYCRKLYAANREARNESQRKRYAANRATRIARSQAYRKAHPEETKARDKLRYLRNQDAYKQAQQRRNVKSRKLLEDTYIKKTLTHGSVLSTVDIPSELVEAKRAQLKLKRLLKEIQNGEASLPTTPYA